MPGNDEKTQIEAFASPGCSKMPSARKRGRKNRGVPPPPTFDIDTLPGSPSLTALEAAAVIRRTPGALEQWRRDPNDPLKWRYVDGRPLYRVDAVRDYLASCDKKSSALGEPVLLHWAARRIDLFDLKWDRLYCHGYFL